MGFLTAHSIDEIADSVYDNPEAIYFLFSAGKQYFVLRQILMKPA